MSEQAPRDQNFVPTMLLESSTNPGVVLSAKGDEATGRLLVDSASGSGTVTSVSVVTANGVSGSVATATTTPAITLTLGAITPSAIQVSGLTASEMVITDASKNLVSAAVATYPSLTELTYVKGVTSALQTQLNAKAPTTAPTFATSITGSYLTASEILITDGSKNIVSAAVATYPSLTELTYVKGVTSAIQTQINTKQATITFGTDVQTALGVNIGSAGAVVLYNGALGTPSSGTVTNLTGTASININGTVGATTPTTGVFTTVNGLTITANGTNTFNLSAGKTFQVVNTLGLQGTDGTVMTFPTTSATIARTDAGQTFTGVSGATSWNLTTPVIVSTATVGTASSATGALLFKGTTSGTVTFSVADAAGTWTMKLPTTDGDASQFLQTDGSGNTTWATPTAAAIVYKNGVTTRDPTAASGNQTIAHGLSATPSFIRITCIAYDAGAGVDMVSQSYGVYNGTTMSNVWSFIDPSDTVPNAGNSSAAVATLYFAQDGTNRQVATVTVDGTNITLAWTKTGTPEGGAINIMWEAM